MRCRLVVPRALTAVGHAVSSLRRHSFAITDRGIVRERRTIRRLRYASLRACCVYRAAHVLPQCPETAYRALALQGVRWLSGDVASNVHLVQILTESLSAMIDW